MPKIKLHYDGWLALPATLRAQLNLKSGDPLEVTLVDGTLVLRPAARERHAAQPQTEVEMPAAGVPPPVQVEPAATTSKRTRRAAKTDAAEPAPPPKRRGRPPKTADASEPEPATMPSVDPGTSQLRKKAMAPPLAMAELATSFLDCGGRSRNEVGPRPAEERRPFRQVEVRKLGPGRGRNRRPRLTA